MMLYEEIRRSDKLSSLVSTDWDDFAAWPNANEKEGVLL